MAVAKIFSQGDSSVAIIGLAGTAHQTAAEEAGIEFIPGTSLEPSKAQLYAHLCPEWFADLDYSDEGKLLITKFVHSYSP